MGRVVSFALAIFVFVLSACGGGGDDSGAPKSTSEPKPRPIAAAMGAYDEAIADDSCQKYNRFVFSLIRQRPTATVTFARSISTALLTPK